MSLLASLASHGGRWCVVGKVGDRRKPGNGAVGSLVGFAFGAIIQNAKDIPHILGRCHCTCKAPRPRKDYVFLGVAVQEPSMSKLADMK